MHIDIKSNYNLVNYLNISTLQLIQLNYFTKIIIYKL